MARSVYVIGGEAGPQKIGISANVDGRLAWLQSNSPHALRAHHAQPASDARLVERVAHQLLAAKRLHGEWFDVSIAEAITAIDQAIDLVESGDLSPLPVDNGVRFVTLRLPVAVHEQLREMAYTSRRSQHALAMEALNLLFDRHGKPPIAPQAA